MNHILVTQGDWVEDVTNAARSGKSLRWIVPKTASPGDKAILFYRPQSFLGTAEVISQPEAAEFGQKNAYASQVGKIAMFPEPIPLEIVGEKFPEWAWLRYPRSYTSVEAAFFDRLIDFLTSVQPAAQPERAEWFTKDEYINALRTIEPHLSTQMRAMLKAHAEAPNRAMTVFQLAAAGGSDSDSLTYGLYGRLGHMLSDALEPDVPVEAGAKIIWTRYIGEDYRETEGAPISWMMHVQLAQALAELGWAKPSLVDIRDAKDEDFKLPEEIEAEAPIREGAKKTIVVNAYERSLEARAKCIQHYGYRCSACGLMLAEKYGEAAAERLIHVHHLCPQAERNGEYQIDPIQDLRPVCPNCHAVIHNHSPIFTVEEVRSMIEQQAKLVTTPPKTA